MPRLSTIWGCAVLISLLAGCQHEPSDPGPPPREPVGLIWGSGASGAFVEDTVPLLAFFRDSADDPMGLPRPVVTWTSSNPAVLEIVSDTLAVALATGTAVLTAVTPDPPAYALDVLIEVIPRWQGRLVWARQPAPGVQPALAVQEFPGHEVQQLPDVGYPGAASGDPYLSSDGRYAAATGTRPIAPGANRTIFVVDLVTGDVTMPLDPLRNWNQFSAAWFPGDTLLAFLMEAATGYEVFTARPDGSGVQQRTQLGQAAPPFFDLTPEGNVVLKLGYGPAADLFEVTLSGDPVRQVTATPDYEETTPAVSPDGSALAFVATLNPGAAGERGSHVLVMDRDGANPRRLLPRLTEITGSAPRFSNYPAQSRHPSWTADSKFVLLTWSIDPHVSADGQGYDTLGELYAIRLADGLAIRLTRTPTIDAQAVFR